MNNNYRVTNESLAREQFEIFMKDVYDKVDSLSVDIDKELLTVFTNLSLVGEEYKYDQKIADKVIKAANKTPEFGTREFFDQYTINELKTIAKDNKLTIMPKSKKEDIIALLVTSKIDYSKIPTSSKIVKGINNSVSKYLNVKDSTYLGLGGEIKKYTNKVLSKLDTLDEYADRKTYGVYSSILDNLNKLSLELNKFKKYSGVYQKKIELINLYKKEVEKYDELINKALEDLKSSKSDVEKVFIQNQIKAYKDTKANFENNIVSYENEIKSSVSKDLNGLSALEYSNYLTGLVDNVWNEFRRGFADDSIAIDVDADTYKMFKTSYTYVKGDIESIFSKVVSKETELNELCSKYGISKEVEEVKEGPKFFNKPSEEVKEKEPNVVKQDEPKEVNLVINNDKLTEAASMLIDSNLYSEDDINRMLQDLDNVKTTEEVNKLVKYIIYNKWNVRDAENVIDNYLDRLERGEIIAAEKKQSIKIESGKLTSAKQMLIDSKLYSEDDINRILQDLNNVKTAEEINNLVKRIIDNKWNVRDAEEVIDNYLDEVEKPKIAEALNNNLESKNDVQTEKPVEQTVVPVIASNDTKSEETESIEGPSNEDYDPEIDKEDESALRMVNSIKDPVLIKPRTFGSNYAVFSGTPTVDRDGNPIEINEEQVTPEENSVDESINEEPVIITNPDQVEDYDLTLRDKMIQSINNAGDKFVNGIQNTYEEVKSGGIKVIGKKMIEPAKWVQVKAKALKAAAAKKVYVWAKNNFENQFEQAESNSQGVSR